MDLDMYQRQNNGVEKTELPVFTMEFMGRDDLPSLLKFQPSVPQATRLLNQRIHNLLVDITC